MTVVYIILLLLVSIGPVYVAWARGDAILNSLESRRRRRRFIARLKSTRRLPVSQEALGRLLEGNAQLEDIEVRLADALQRLARLPQPGSAAAAADPAKMAEQMEEPILVRESRFSDYLDTAWAQNEALDVMEQEIRLLRSVAGLPDVWPEPGTTPRPSSNRSAGSTADPTHQDATAPTPQSVGIEREQTGAAVRHLSEQQAASDKPSPAAKRLMENLREVSERRRKLDHRLSNLGHSPGEKGGTDDDHPPPTSTRSFIA